MFLSKVTILKINKQAHAVGNLSVFSIDRVAPGTRADVNSGADAGCGHAGQSIIS
jgi:hypothetical protein